jgi:hypothetical protein
MPLVPIQPGHDASVRPDSAFASELRDLIHMARPRRILETGTLHALGTTLIVSEALKINGIEADFRSIECNPHHVAHARHNIEHLGLPVKLVEGLSIPRSQLPTLAEVQHALRTMDALPDPITIDFPESSDPAADYCRETGHPEKPDNWIGKILDEWAGCCDLAILDSAGHLGMSEIETLLDHLRTRCYIALDDTAHVKHYLTRHSVVSKNPDRFRIVAEGSDRFGWCIVHYTP